MWFVLIDDLNTRIWPIEVLILRHPIFVFVLRYPNVTFF